MSVIRKGAIQLLRIARGGEGVKFREFCSMLMIVIGVTRGGGVKFPKKVLRSTLVAPKCCYHSRIEKLGLFGQA